MLIFQRMQILCAALLLGVNFILVGCGTVRQDPADDENLVVSRGDRHSSQAGE